jgi:hypothetical protein
MREVDSIGSDWNLIYLSQVAPGNLSWERRHGTPAEQLCWGAVPACNERFSAPNSTGSVSDLVGSTLASTLDEARRHMLGPRASLPAMSALARNIEVAPPLKVTQSTQPTL